jgi:hypothetical protein
MSCFRRWQENLKAKQICAYTKCNLLTHQVGSRKKNGMGKMGHFGEIGEAMALCSWDLQNTLCFFDRTRTK